MLICVLNSSAMDWLEPRPITDRKWSFIVCRIIIDTLRRTYFDGPILTVNNRDCWYCGITVSDFTPRLSYLGFIYRAHAKPTQMSTLLDTSLSGEHHTQGDGFAPLRHLHFLGVTPFQVGYKTRYMKFFNPMHNEGSTFRHVSLGEKDGVVLGWV